MITIKFNIDFGKALRKIEGDKILELANEGVISPIAKASSDFIRAGKVIPGLKPITISVKEKEGSSTPKIPLMMTGKLVNSLKGTTKGIMGENYGSKHREGEYVWTENTSYKVFPKPTVPGKGLIPRKREFIVSFISSEQGNVDKIYKEFQDKFVKLIDKSIRK